MIARRMVPRLLALLVPVLLAGACATDGAAPGGQGDGRRPEIQLPAGAPVDQVVVDRISGTLNCLYDRGVIPNPNSVLGKLNSLVTALTNDDYAAALSAYRDLVAFLRNWQSNNNTNLAASLSCPNVQASISTVGEAFDLALADLQTLIAGVPGTICLIEGEGECEAIEGEAKAKIYFPPEIYQQLTAVSIQLNPPGFQRLQAKLDEYPTYVRILTGGVSDFSGFAQKPLVMVCYTQTLLSTTPAPVLNRLLLGSLHLGTTFKLLPAPTGSYAGRLDTYCPPTQTSASMGGPGSGVLARLASFLLPERLHATGFLLTTRGGVGGSAEEFSEFGAVDPGIRTRGGVGGSAEEFAPPQAAPGSGVAAVTVSPDGVTFTGDIGEQVTDTTKLPAIQAYSPTQGTPIAGMTVRFRLLPPPMGASSQATFCDGTTEQTTATNANGVARPTCINFGPVPGKLRLEAQMSPSSVTPNACLLDGDTGQVCQTGLTRNFIIETYEPPAELSCMLGSKTNKVSLGAFDGTKWTAHFEYTPELTGRIRQVTLYMSVTGQSSGLSEFPVRLTARRGSLTGTTLSVGTRVLNSTTGNIQLPGDNGSYFPVTIGLTPTSVVPAGAGNTNKVFFTLEVTAPSTRTPQLWYRTDKLNTGDPCLASIVYANGTTPATAGRRDIEPGLGVIINNTVWTP